MASRRITGDEARTATAERHERLAEARATLIESVGAEIKALEVKLAERSVYLIEIKKETEDASKAAEGKAAKAARLAELNKDIEAKKKEAQALKDELS